MIASRLKKSLTLILMCILCSILVYAEKPAYVTTNQLSLRYIFVSENKGEHTLKVDSRTGKVWYLISKKDASKTTLRLFKNLPNIDESQSYDGRFIFESSVTGGGETVYFMMDSKTGKVWQLHMFRYESTEILESTE